MSDSDAKAVVRLGLKPIDPAALVLEDPVLSRATLVRALGDRAPDALADGRMRRLAPGGTAYRAGEPAEYVVLVVRGDLSLVAGDGVEAVRLSTGDLCAAGSALGLTEHDLTATAVTETDVLELPGALLASLAEERPPVKQALEETRQRNGGAASDLEAFLDRW